MSDWSQIFQNSKSIALKRFIAQIIDHKVNNYDDLLTRISSSLVTETDVKLFGELMNDIIAAGYYRAINDYKEKLG